jgi:hypothetical protein
MTGRLDLTGITVTATRTDKGAITGGVTIADVETTIEADGTWLKAGDWCVNHTFRTSAGGSMSLGAGQSNSIGWYANETAKAVGEHTHKVTLTYLLGNLTADTVQAKTTGSSEPLRLTAAEIPYGDTKIATELESLQKQITAIETKLNGAKFTFKGNEATISDSADVTDTSHAHPIPTSTSTSTSNAKSGGKVSVSTKYTPSGSVSVTWGS